MTRTSCSARATRQLLGPARCARAGAVRRRHKEQTKPPGNGETDVTRAADKISLQQKVHTTKAASKLTAAWKRHADAQSHIRPRPDGTPRSSERTDSRQHCWTSPLADVDSSASRSSPNGSEPGGCPQSGLRERGNPEVRGSHRESSGSLTSGSTAQKVNRPLQALHDLPGTLAGGHRTGGQAPPPSARRPAFMPIRPETMTAESGERRMPRHWPGAEDSGRAEASPTRAATAASGTCRCSDGGIQTRVPTALRDGASRESPPSGCQREAGCLTPTALDPVIEAETSARDDAERRRADQAPRRARCSRQATSTQRPGPANQAQRRRRTAQPPRRRQVLPVPDRQAHARAARRCQQKFSSRLSGGGFGFAENFQIVSRRSGAARGPRTLSGGETFLASLALALALVEMHSRSGARLDALFLDEGFGSLDADALTSSLAVLQAETGGNKLVAVISHLHAVAEAVEDAMWFKRQPDGSTARWLTAAERDALVRQEITSGLLNLI